MLGRHFPYPWPSRLFPPDFGAEAADRSYCLKRLVGKIRHRSVERGAPCTAGKAFSRCQIQPVLSPLSYTQLACALTTDILLTSRCSDCYPPRVSPSRGPTWCCTSFAKQALSPPMEEDEVLTLPCRLLESGHDVFLGASSDACSGSPLRGMYACLNHPLASITESGCWFESRGWSRCRHL